MSDPGTTCAPYKCPFQTRALELLLPVPTWSKWEFALCTALVAWRFLKLYWSIRSTVGLSVPPLWKLLVFQDPESQAKSSAVCGLWQSSGLHPNKEPVSGKKGKQENWNQQLTAPQHFSQRHLLGLFSQGRVQRWLEVHLPCELSPQVVRQWQKMDQSNV